MTNADTMTLTPQWKRQLSEGDNSSILTSSSTKVNLAKYRYSREEMLAFFNPRNEPPEYLKKYPEILCPNAVQPYNFKGLTDDEQYVISQGVNSAVVTRVLSSRGRGEMRGDRGRGRGSRRGAGSGFVYLGGDDYEDKEFDRPRGRGRGNHEGSRGSHRGRIYHSSLSTGDNSDHLSHPADADSGGEWRRPRHRQTSNSEDDTNWRRRDNRVPGEHRGSRGGQPSSGGGYRGSWRQKDNSANDGSSKQQPFYSYRGNSSHSRGRHHEEFNHHDSDNSFSGPTRGGQAADHSGRTKRGSENLEDIWQEDWDNEFEQAYVEEDFPNFPDFTDDNKDALSRSNSQPDETNVNQSTATNTNTVTQRPSGFSEALKVEETIVQRWTYKDPQGNIQGPFSDREMFDWHSAGFFQECLMVKREVDECYAPLGDYIKFFRRLPFTPGPIIPSLKAGTFPPTSTLYSPNLTVGPAIPSPTAMPANSMPSSDNNIPRPVTGIPSSTPQVLPHLIPPPSTDQSSIINMLQQQELFQRFLSQGGIPQDQSAVLNSLLALQQAVASSGMPPTTSPDHLPSHPGFTLPQNIGLPLPSESSMNQKVPAPSIWDIQKKEAQLEEEKRLKEEALRRQEAEIEAERKKLEELKLQFEKEKAEEERKLREKYEEEERRRRERAEEEERQLKEKARMLEMERLQNEKLEKERELVRRQEEERFKKHQDMLLQQQEAERQKHLETIRQQQEAERLRHEELLRQQNSAYHQFQSNQSQSTPVPVTASASSTLESETSQQRQISYSESIKLKHEQLDQPTDLQRKRQEQMRQQDQLEKEREGKYQKELEKAVAEDAARRQKLKEAEEDQRKSVSQTKNKMSKKEREELERQRLYNDAFKKKQAEELERRRLAERMYEDTTLLYSEEIEISVQQASELAAAQKVEKERQELERKREEERLSRLQLPQSARWGKELQSTNPNCGMSLTEIQRSEKARVENESTKPAAHVPAPTPTSRPDSGPVLSAWGLPVTKQKTLAEIQAEEVELEKKNRKQSAGSGNWGLRTGPNESSQWSNMVKANSNQPPVHATTAMKPTGTPSVASPAAAPASGASIWDMGKPNPPSTSNKNQSVPQHTNSQKQKSKKEVPKSSSFEIKANVDELTLWCEKALEGQTKQLDVDLPTLVEILRDIESPYEVEDYIKSYFGQSQRLTQFTKDFLQKRKEFPNAQNQSKQSATLDQSKAVNNNHGSNKTDQWQTQSKSSNNKKNKKKKMQQVNTKLLGFTCTSDPNRPNAGEIERP